MMVPPPTDELSQLAAEARMLATAAKSGNTLKAYEADWTHFTGWCATLDLNPCPASPETVMLYLAALARSSRKTSTIARRLAAISNYHHLNQFPSPSRSIDVQAVLEGIRRTKRVIPNRKQPLLGKSIAAAASAMPEGTLLGIRNRALLLIGYAGALRRSELVALNWEDCVFTDQGQLRLLIRASKTDQSGEGTEIGIPPGTAPASCPVAALRAWKDASGLSQGPVFRVLGRASLRFGKIMDERLSTKAVARLVKQVAASLGLDPRQFSAHSLRAGLATTAAANGVPERKIMDQTRHRSLNTVRVYIRDGELFRENAASKADL